MSVDRFSPAGNPRSSLIHGAFVAFIGVTGCFAPANVFAAPNECPARGAPNPDCAQHNMMIVGDQTVFLSHLPMFASAHRFQVILEAALVKDKVNSNSVYTKDRKEHSDVRMYTLKPLEIFVLAQLFSGDDKARLTSFPGTVFRGHLERGGVRLKQLTGIDVDVQRVMYAQEIGPPRGPDRAKALEYIIFGKGQDIFLAHRITQPPDFDQLLSVKISGHTLTDDELNKGVVVTVPDRPNEPARRLRRGETAKVQGRVTGAQAELPLEVMVVAEPYFEEGELASRFTMDPTPLEIEAGFGD
jgi:hypothetical protein